ncbi:uncharacterized protein METZ01_LOCUS383701 [marine metagenome]|uniref:Uncharacterized protein n=1 Tax=marine metagenome TaxID=408172 RepID=A0A382UA17_9ZZZZ
MRQDDHESFPLDLSGSPHQPIYLERLLRPQSCVPEDKGPEFSLQRLQSPCVQSKHYENYGLEIPYLQRKAQYFALLRHVRSRGHW